MSKKGFTLIELLLVIAIIAILAAGVILVITPGERLKQARESTRLSHFESIATAIHTKVLDCTTPTTCGSVATFISSNCSPDANGVAEFGTSCASAARLPEPPKDPQTGTFYYIKALDTNRLKVWTTSTADSQWNSEANAKIF